MPEYLTDALDRRDKYVAVSRYSSTTQLTGPQTAQRLTEICERYGYRFATVLSEYTILLERVDRK